jgi:hypothetical protein
MISAKRYQTMMKMALGVGLCVLLFLIYEKWCGTPVASSQLERLFVGMSINQVEQNLGKPTVHLRHAANYATSENCYWSYEFPFHRLSLWVFFDEHHRYAGYELDSVGQ